MQCPSCGAVQEMELEQCPQCDAVNVPNESPVGHDMLDTPVAASNSQQNPQSTSKLIEFPGVSRTSVPQWRKELHDRVREVQEKRAREAALEAALEAADGSHDQDHDAKVPPLLELLPQTEVAPLNPLVTAALRRIERAHHAAQGVSRMAGAPGGAALAYVTESEYRAEALTQFEFTEVATVSSFDTQEFDGQTETEPEQLEKVHNLVVVPPPVPKEDIPAPRPKPRRMIADNDPALNYLDSIPTSIRVDVVKYEHASAFKRVFGALVDLMVVAILCGPFVAVVQLTNGNWRDLRFAVTAAVLYSVMSFLYFTISAALTGRTVGMRLFSLRIVDARTGLIPTGKQSAGRALVYLGTILTAGLASLYVLIDRDKQTAHDRLARTTVISA